MECVCGRRPISRSADGKYDSVNLCVKRIAKILSLIYEIISVKIEISYEETKYLFRV